MNPTLTITPERTTLRLSDTITVSVAVEGDAPLRIDPPKETLAGESAAVWSAVRTGDARAEPLPGGRERWTQEYRCSPYAAGGTLPLEFSALRVKAGTAVEEVSLAAPPLTFRVETDLAGAKAEDARPVTGVEPLPPPPATPIGLPAVWAVGVGGLLVAAAAVFATVRRRTRRPEVPPTAEALTAFDALGTPPALDRVAEIVRRFLGRRFGVPAGTTTTAELLGVVRERMGWPAEQVTELDAILTLCDRAKFAGGAPDAATATGGRERARAWVAAMGGTG